MEHAKKAIAKVPEVTLVFWIIKIAATTLGETGGDALSMSMNLGYLMSTFIFAAVFIVAWIVDALAPTFGGQKDPLAALKVAAYSLTPAWVAAILTILPSLGFIAALLGLYGLYLLYLGLPVLMRAPTDRALGYTVVVVISAIVVNIVITAVIGMATGGLVAQHM